MFVAADQTFMFVTAKHASKPPVNRVKRSEVFWVPDKGTLERKRSELEGDVLHAPLNKIDRS
jgi:hypothetical protein